MSVVPDLENSDESLKGDLNWEEPGLFTFSQYIKMGYF